MLLRYGYGVRGTPGMLRLVESAHRFGVEDPVMREASTLRTSAGCDVPFRRMMYTTHTSPELCNPRSHQMHMQATEHDRELTEDLLCKITPEMLFNHLPENAKTDITEKAAEILQEEDSSEQPSNSLLMQLPGFRQMVDVLQRVLLRSRKGRNMKKNKNGNDTLDASDLIDLLGRRSGLRRLFYRNIDNVTNLAVSIAADTFHEFAENNLYSTLQVFGHYDTFISKSAVKVLLRYLYPKYGKHILMDVDGNFSMCSISIDKIKKSVLGFPELVNKTIRPGIYWVKLSNVGKGTYMIVVKSKLFSESDISENGIRSQVKNFKTSIIFMGDQKNGWRDRIQKEIDGFCSGLVTTSASSDKIRVQSMGGGESAQNDIIIRPMQNLVFPQKDSILKRIQTFLDSGKIYKENGIPYRKGYLLWGPRGTGKTAFAFSLAQYFNMECVSVDLSFFDTNGGANAFNGSNTVYIIDEIDAQLPKSRVSETHEAVTVEQQKIIDRLHKLLKAMDDMSEGSIIIGTTNFPDRLDPAIVRSGRFDEVLEFGNLDKDFAISMCNLRGINPDKVLDGESFPINPAYLEQKLIEALLEKNSIMHTELKSAEEIIQEEFGVEIKEENPAEEATASTELQENPSDAEDDDDDEDVLVTSSDADAESRIETVATDEGDARMVLDDEDDDEEEEEEPKPSK